MPKHNRKIKFNWNKKLTTTYTVVGVCSCNSLATRWGTRNLIFIVVFIHLWPLLHRCSLIALCLVQQARLWPSINGCSHSKKTVWRERTRLTSPEVWASTTSKAWRDSDRASFSPPHSRRQKETLLAGWNINCSGGSRGGPLIFRPDWGLKGQKTFFGRLSPPLSKGLDDAPPPPPPRVSQGLDPALHFELTCN